MKNLAAVTKRNNDGTAEISFSLSGTPNSAKVYIRGKDDIQIDGSNLKKMTALDLKFYHQVILHTLRVVERLEKVG